MNTIRKALARARDEDSGLTLIEVIVAMTIFAMVAMGVAYSMIAVLRMTNDARSKQTATNLAAAEIDTARAATDIIHLGPHTSVVLVDGISYTVATTVGWVNAQTGGTASQCSTGSGAILFKQVNVSVRWTGMSPGASPVTSSTVVAPTGRLNDANKGVIIVSVKTAAGAGNPNITIKAVPDATTPNGATAISSTIDPTDAQGCAAILQVVPGKYTVSVSSAASGNPYVDIKQSSTPTLSVDVTAGNSTPAPFQFDQAGAYSVNYHSNYTTGTVVMPPGMVTSFVNTYGIYTSAAAAPFMLHPYTAGYSAIAGTLAPSGSSASSCLSVDPGAWPANAAGTLVGVRSPAVAAVPGGTATLNAPMGVFSISGISGQYLKAVAQTTGLSGTDDPGCSTPSTYVIPIPTGTSAKIALPYGTWLLTTGTTATSQTSKPALTTITPLTTGATTKSSGDTYLTLDPRTAP